jgi:hypothetical protein
MKSFFRTAALLMFVSAPMLADGSLEGTWTGQTGSDETAQPITMVMKSDGVAVSGSIIGGGGEMSIQEGSLAGNILKFKSTQYQADGASLKMSCTGTLTNDSLAMSCTTEGDTPATSEFSLTRQAQ